ncbi:MULTISPECIES: hypothetical protein [unclassified Microcoleus]|uniref:hypothetical protein n=1 Tax=unclassified Microcoleus TaxID=2642155 RepID=UPI002FD55B85
MLKVAIIKVIQDSFERKFFAQTEEGEVPPGFPTFPDNNGEECLIKIFPVDEKGIETYGERTNSEEVEVCLCVDGVNLPQGVRWFVRRKGSNAQIGDLPKVSKTFRLSVDVVKRLEILSAACGRSQASILEDAFLEFAKNIS